MVPFTLLYHLRKVHKGAVVVHCNIIIEHLKLDTFICKLDFFWDVVLEIWCQGLHLGWLFLLPEYLGGQTSR